MHVYLTVTQLIGHLNLLQLGLLERLRQSLSVSRTAHHVFR